MFGSDDFQERVKAVGYKGYVGSTQLFSAAVGRQKLAGTVLENWMVKKRETELEIVIVLMEEILHHLKSLKS